jgi:ligand-binding sensor domain-containing protein/tRNA A-37 threonylcarbamoyl transferase component Bud32
MSDDRWQRIEDVFQQAADLPALERTRFLAAACAGDDRLRREVESLLAHDQPQNDVLVAAISKAVGEPPDSRPIPDFVGRQIGPYRIISLLGRGGMGAVYKARDSRLERDVAIKVLPEARDEGMLRVRFEREARAASALNHHNICSVYDVGEFEDHPFLVMELLEGGTLREYIDTQPRDFGQILRLTFQIVEALDAAHAKRIVHRDIKPANIFVTERGDVKLLDFGLASPAALRAELAETSAQGMLTGPGSAIGTIAYMSPEQARGEALDARTDLWSLGVVLYEMLTGSRPFEGSTAAVVFDAILNKAPVPVRERNPKVRAELARIISKLLEKDRELRYQSAAGLRADLAGQAVSVSPAGYRRPVRRLLAAGAVLAIVTLRIVGALHQPAQRIPAGVGPEYSFRAYGAAEGLENLVVLSLAQDRAGYIWAGTEGGLYRYDGARFRLMGLAEGLPCSTETDGLFLASDGALWANLCGGIFRFDGGRFQPVSGLETLLLPRTQVMADGADGAVLIATLAGLYEASRGANGGFSMHPYPLPAALAGMRIHGILERGGHLWFGCGRRLCLEEGGRVSVFGPEEGLPEDSWDAILISPDGSVWVGSPKSLYRRAPGQRRFSLEKLGLANRGLLGALQLGRDGSVLVPTDRGLAIHTEAGWSIVNRQRGLRNEGVAAVLEDRLGSVWVGLLGGGVARWIGRGVWESWKKAQGLPSDLIWSIRRDRKGALWIGTVAGLARLGSSGQIRTWTRKNGLGGDNVRWLAETSDGSIWAVMKPGGLARVDPATGKIRLAGKADGLPCDPEDVFVDRHDHLWLPTTCGLFRNDQPSVSNRVTRVQTPESFGPSAWKVMEDAHGTIWVTNRTALWSLRDGQWRQHRRAEGLLTDNPYLMALARDGSIWLRHRYDAGVDRLDVSGDRIVRATAVVPADPKSGDVTDFLGFDAFGNFWRGSANGVAVLRGDTWTSFTTEDGLVWNDCDGEAFWGDPDGSVWLGTSGGLAHYSPGKGGQPGPLVVDPIIASLEIFQPHRLIRVEFSTLNFKAEQLVRFGYRLDGASWTDLSESKISITGIGPGTHRLEVRSRVRDGPFSPRIAAAEFRIDPKWREAGTGVSAGGNQ